MEEIIKQYLNEDDDTSKQLKQVMEFAQLTIEDLVDIYVFTESKSKQELLYEVEKIIEEGGV